MNNTNKKGGSGLLLIIILLILLLPGRSAIKYLQLDQAFNNKEDGSQYNGDIRLSNSINKNKVTVHIPEGYKDVGGRTNYFISKEGQEIISSDICKLTIDTVANYKNAEHLTEAMAAFNKTEYDKVNLNGTSWYHVNRISTPNSHTYVTDYNNKMYIIEADYLSENCEKDLLSIIQTVTIK